MSSNTEIATSKVLLDGQQAEDEMKRLATLATDLKKKLRLAVQNGDESGAKAIKKQLTDVEKEAASAKRELNSVSSVMKNLNGSSLKQLQGAQRQLNAEIRTSTRNTEEEIAALKLKKQQYAAINTEINKVKAGMNTAAGTEGRLGSLITKAQLAYFAVAAAIGAVAGFARSAYKAYEEQEIANKRLLFSLQGNKTAYYELTKQAGELQKRLGIPDETINQIQMLAAETGKTTSQIKKITEAAIELSLATGEDLQGSYMKLNATFTGSAGRLGRLDADFTKLSKTQLENGAAIDLVLTKYGGLADKSVSPVKQLTAAWEEFKESVGSSGSSLEPLFNALTKFVYLLGESVKSVRQIKAEVAQDNSAQDVISANEEIQKTKDSLVKKGMKEKLADQKAYDIYISSQRTTVEEAQKRDTDYLVDYTTLTGKARDKKWEQIKANEEYIKSITDEVEGVKKSRAAVVSFNEDADNDKPKQTVDELKGAYDLLTERISTIDKEIKNAIASGNIPLAQKLQLEKEKAQELLAVYDELAKQIEKGWKLPGKEMGPQPLEIVNGVELISGKTATNVKPDTKYVSPLQPVETAAAPATEEEAAQAVRDRVAAEEASAQNVRDEWGNVAIQSAQTLNDTIFSITASRRQAELDHAISINEKQRAAELSNKNLTEAQKDAINAKYDNKNRKLQSEQAKKQKTADIISSVVKTALAVLTQLSGGDPYTAMPRAVAAGIAGLAQTAVIVAQEVPEFATGRYNITGAQTGKQYNNIPYTGPAVTGLYTRPALVGETGAEMIIDANTTRNLMVNFPEILEAIHNSRVNQFAAGRYPEKSVNPSDLNASKILNTELLSILKGTNELLQKLDKEGIKAKSTWTLFDLEKIQKDKLLIENSSDM